MVMVPLKVGTLSLGWWSVVYCGGPKMIVSLSFSPGWPAPTSVWAMLWRSSCSSCARPASKSASVICGVEDGSDPPPVAAGLSTVKHEYGLFGLPELSTKAFQPLMVLLPTFPASPGVTAWMFTPDTTPLTPAVVFHGTVTLPDVWANMTSLELTNRCPRRIVRPGPEFPN